MFVADALSCVLLMLFTCQIIRCSQRSTANFTRNDELNGRNCMINDTVIQIDNTTSILMCGSVCLRENKCRSFFYEPETKQCHGCRTGYVAHKLPSAQLAGSIHYSNGITSVVPYLGYVGCFRIDNPYGNTYVDYEAKSEDMDPELCVGICAAKGYRYTLNWWKYCQCIDVVHELDRESDDFCDDICPGNPLLMCGRGMTVHSVYATGQETQK